MAQVVEVEISLEGEIKVHRLVCAADCGTTVNPLTVRGQIEGGMLFGLNAALREEITVREGGIEQSNFADYPPMRMRDAPHIDIHLVDSREPAGGMGEAPTAGVAPALVNAIFAAAATRVRRLPVSRTKLKPV